VSWEGLNPPYATVVVDPPWPYPAGLPTFSPTGQGGWDADRSRRAFAYSTMPVADITALPVGELAAPDARLWLWTTNRYLPAAFGVIEAWGFRYSTTVVWAKDPMGVGPGDPIAITTEYLLSAVRGSPGRPGKRAASSWYRWQRGSHSVKPAAALDMIEQVSPAPRVELFARAQRLGWDSWGWGYEHAG
jgi:N6-adenosine-specific RNA methylase IME4